MTTCPLCALNFAQETVFYEDESIVIVRAKDLKGHRERIMVVFRDHQATIPEAMVQHALRKLEEVGRHVFDYTDRFVILAKTFATFPEHWHKVCSDLDPTATDYDQVLETPWIKIVDVNNK
jgi:hypothetical protein